MIGILQEAINIEFLNMNNIKSIFGTSIGSIIGIVFSLKIDPKIISDYFIKRPWETVFKKNRYSFLDIYDRKGIIHRGFLENLFEPLLKSIELSIDITFSELYAYNGIDIHIYVTEINNYKLLDISYKTHPEWSIIDAIYASCSIPILFSPLIKDNKCYIDGGFILNYPITKCIYDNPKEVLGISAGNYNDLHKESPIISSSNIFDFIFSILFNIIKYYSLFENDNSELFPYQIKLYNKTTLDYFMEVLYKKEEREHLVIEGNETFKTYYKNWNNITTHSSQTELDSAL